MKRLFKCSRALSLLTALAMSVTAVPFTVNAEDRDDPYRDMENKFVEIINEARAERGAEPLEISSYLGDCADIRALELSYDFSHTRPDNTKFSSVIDFDMFPYLMIYENVMGGFTNAEDVIIGIKDEPTYWNTLMDPENDSIGVGVAYVPDTKYGWYWINLVADTSLDNDTPGEDSHDSMPTECKDIVELINNYRNEKGLSPLKLSETLNEAANIRTEELAVEFSHMRPNGKSFSSAIDYKSYPYYMIMEDCARGFETSEETFKAFLDVDTSYRNIVSPDVNEIGVGYKYIPDSPSENYWCILYSQMITENEPIVPDPEKDPIAEFLSLLNAERSQLGIAPLTVNEYLNDSAEVRAGEITQKFSHQRADGSYFYSAVDVDVYNYRHISETIAAGFGTAEETMEQFKNSPQQWKDLMNGEATDVGIALHKDESAEHIWYWDVILADKYDTQRPVENVIDDLTKYIEEMETIINSEREANGLAPLKVNADLCDAAKMRAEESAEYFAHTRPDGSSFSTAINSTGYKYKLAYENLAAGADSAQEAMDLFKSSPKHWSAISDPEIEEMGIAVVYDPNKYYGWYWTQLFAIPDKSSKNQKNISYLPLKLGEPIPVSYADLNGDTTVDIYDYVILLDYITSRENGNLKHLTEAQLEAADCSGDGDVTVADAVLLMKFILGAIDKFPCQE